MKDLDREIQRRIKEGQKLAKKQLHFPRPNGQDYTLAEAKGAQQLLVRSKGAGNG